MTAWIFTFGPGQRLRSSDRAGRADLYWNGQPTVGEGFALHNRYVRIEGDHDQARTRMVAIFGPVWSMQYEEGPDTDEMLRGFRLVELDLTEPVGEPRRPWLGLATTRDLLRELQARGEASYGRAGRVMGAQAEDLLHDLPEAMLDYRTVGGDTVAEATP